MWPWFIATALSIAGPKVTVDSRLLFSALHIHPDQSPLLLISVSIYILMTFKVISHRCLSWASDPYLQQPIELLPLMPLISHYYHMQFFHYFCPLPSPKVLVLLLMFIICVNSTIIHKVVRARNFSFLLIPPIPLVSLTKQSLHLASIF